MNKDNYPAHIKRENGGWTVQTVQQHCQKTAEYTELFLRDIGMGKTGYLLGLLHDSGKMTNLFSDYIQRAAEGDNVRRGSVNHTFSAVKMILNRYHSTEDHYRRLAAEVIAYSLGAHHGLFDCVGPDHRNGFVHRLMEENTLFRESSENYFRHICCPEELDNRFVCALDEMKLVFMRLIDISARDSSGGELSYYLGCFTRLLLSALIDGDRRDTWEFMSGKEYPLMTRHNPELWQECLKRVVKKLSMMHTETDIQIARARFSALCQDQAKSASGVYRLNLPTGAGKTLGSLRFALAHAAKHNKKRIIFTSPLLSILEQNAAVLRAYLQDDGIILEHHSNAIHSESEPETLSMNELLEATWDSPVIITTLVQLMNTMFSGKTAAIRRFHALCNSVIVIDEVQSVPPKLLSMFQLMITFLAEVCGATVVLCSATQPADEYTQHPFFQAPKLLIEYDSQLWETFVRTKVKEMERCPLESIPEHAERLLRTIDSLLIVCNKKDEALYLFRELQDPSYDCFHLSAAMCAAHRADTLDALNLSLKEKKRKTVCISTQVIEAGVDISFACVVRLAAGMDSVIQSAGRCNRNGETESLGSVYILDCSNENLSSLREIKQAKDATISLLAEYRKDAAAFSFDLTSDRSIRYYYKCLYGNMNSASLDYPVGEHGTLFDLLAGNEKYATEYSEGYGQYYLCQSFKTAGQLFSVFDDDTDTLLVPYGAGAEIIRQIREIGDGDDPKSLQKLHNLLEQAKPFAVSMFSSQCEQLEKLGAIGRAHGGGIWYLKPDMHGNDHYDLCTGIIFEKR